MSAPLAAFVSTQPLAGRTGRDVHKVIQNLVPILSFRAALMVIVGVGGLFVTDWLLPHEAEEFGRATVLAAMVWTPVQLMWLGTVVTVAKRTKWRDRPLPANAWPCGAIRAAPLVAVFGAIAFAVVFH